jgi:hypothetical protein
MRTPPEKELWNSLPQQQRLPRTLFVAKLPGLMLPELKLPGLKLPAERSSQQTRPAFHCRRGATRR